MALGLSLARERSDTMARAEVVIGFAPEDRELIARMLDAQERQADEDQVQAAIAHVEDGRRRALAKAAEYERMWGAASTRLRQLEMITDNVRKIADVDSTDADLNRVRLQQIREVL